MAFVPLKKVQSERGAKSTTPTVTIAENGQLRLNTLSLPPFTALATTEKGKSRKGEEKDVSRCLAVLGWDKENRIVQLKAIKGVPKGWTKENLASITIVPTGAYTAVAGDLKVMGYDYQKSGTQRFTATVNADNITFKLPEGALTPKEKKAKKSKANSVAANAPASEPEELTL